MHPLFKALPKRLYVTVAGVAGFLGFFLAAGAFPAAANILRALAIVWFFAFGLIRFGMDLDAGARADSKPAERAKGRPIKR
jgi:hypothetical protein